ncbi:MAG: sodium:solute symporter [Bacteroidetes bacterium]|nr:sodium:solute symporter [Bacteroidota bacterium]
MNIQVWQWIILIATSILLYLLSPWAKNEKAFFKANTEKGEPGFWLLTASLVISWIFAKSITNAANLGLAFGFVGGVAYAAYYLSFLVAGQVIFRMRSKGGFNSIHEFLGGRFGQKAMWLFSLLIAFRLFNEVWSNTMVIGTYFGPQGSNPYFLAIGLFTLLTLAYSLKGGLRSSLLTDAIQMGLFAILLFVILGILLPRTDYDVTRYVSSGTWSLSTGVNLLLVALLQVFSYPFHDPVLTDRAFISNPRMTRKSFFWATWIGMACILLFSWVGVYAKFQGLEGQAPVEVAQTLGAGMMLLMNVIMVTSAASTLDSTFTSFSKLAVVDLAGGRQISLKRGRIFMAGLTLLGTLPILFGPEILSATTISGTMVIGLAPVFVHWQVKAPPISYFLSVLAGIGFGLCLALGAWPESWIFFPGKYGDLLSANLIGTICCFIGYWIPVLWKRTQHSA